MHDQHPMPRNEPKEIMGLEWKQGRGAVERALVLNPVVVVASVEKQDAAGAVGRINH